MSERFDVIVVGGGAMGTSAARHLAARDREVLLLERFSLGHANGSSGGPTRIFRLTYHDPAYVRMARRALEAWRELEEAAGEQLLITTGGLDVGEAGRTSAEALGAAGETFEYLSSEAVTERWPRLRLPSDVEIFVQEDGGVTRAEPTVRAQARVAASLGATVREETRVVSITPAGDGVEVVTESGDVFRAPVAVVTAGPWAATLLSTAEIDLPLVPSLEQVTYFSFEERHALPTVIDWVPDQVKTPYVVPDPFEPGHFKIGLHMSGWPVDADEGSFDPDPDRIARVVAYAAERFTGFHDEGRTDTCLYTNAPDEHFVIDRIGPVVIGSPCSGHGFKFSPFLGGIFADLATGVEPTLDLSMFRADRPALGVS